MTVPVSVVVPYHDGQAHLGEALASVRAQSAPPAEVILAVAEDFTGKTASHSGLTRPEAPSEKTSNGLDPGSSMLDAGLPSSVLRTPSPALREKEWDEGIN